VRFTIRPDGAIQALVDADLDPVCSLVLEKAGFQPTDPSDPYAPFASAGHEALIVAGSALAMYNRASVPVDISESLSASVAEAVHRFVGGDGSRGEPVGQQFAVVFTEGPVGQILVHVADLSRKGPAAVLEGYGFYRDRDHTFSLRRGTVWERALQQAKAAIDELHTEGYTVSSSASLQTALTSLVLYGRSDVPAPRLARDLLIDALAPDGPLARLGHVLVCVEAAIDSLGAETYEPLAPQVQAATATVLSAREQFSALSNAVLTVLKQSDSQRQRAARSTDSPDRPVHAADTAARQDGRTGPRRGR
jgi:hypothetical protein